MQNSGNAVTFLRRVLPFLTVAVVAGVLYDGWIFYSRWQDTRRAENARREQEAKTAKMALDAIGDGQFRILDFYASPAVIKRGEQSTICFGVNGARRVRIDPPVESLHPAISYCLKVAPRKDTDFTLTAESAAGQTVTRRLRITVFP